MSFYPKQCHQQQQQLPNHPSSHLLQLRNFCYTTDMSKSFVDELIRNMKLADRVSKASPWMVEGIRESQMNVRYVGIKLQDDWLEIFPTNNNLMLKFVIDKNSALVEFYLANKPPFFKIISKKFTEHDKWEIILGDVKRRLKKDKADYLNHTEIMGNLYSLIKPHLK
jgi:hypothetical protein